MTQIITENASLSCDKGAAPSNLKVTSNVFYKADNKLIATEEDKQTAVNISAFGMCTVTRIACVPAITKWDHTAEDTCINTHKVLTEKSTCLCAMGGLISVIDKGHGEQHIIGMGGAPQGAVKQDKKSENSGKNNAPSKSAQKAPAAAKPVLDEKAVQELKQDAKDVFDRAISLGKLLVDIEGARPKTTTEKIVKTETQTPNGTVTETITETTTEDKK